MRDKLIEILVNRTKDTRNGCLHGLDIWADDIADHLIANGVTVNEWISVEERLPTEEGRYLCVTEDYYTKPTVYIYNFANDLSKRCWSIDEKISGWYECDSEFGNTLVDDVTHWMPLPQAPKGEEE